MICTTEIFRERPDYDISLSPIDERLDFQLKTNGRKPIGSFCMHRYHHD